MVALENQVYQKFKTLVNAAVLRTKKGENDHRRFIFKPKNRDIPGKDWGLTFAGFYVQGDFYVARHVNNARKALEEWKRA